MEFFEVMILGILQGIFEWIPISSEGAIFFASTNFFGQTDLNFILREALFLHLGTFLAALIYFRKDVSHLIKSLFNYKHTDTETKKILNFLIVSTIISGVLGLALLQFLKFFETRFLMTSRLITLSIGLLLVMTAILQIKAPSKGHRKEIHLNEKDSILLGIAQGFSALPGLSRSGLTVSSLLFRNIDETSALRLSFLMSLPIVFAGNILLNISDFVLIKELYVGVIFSFLAGLLTIHLFMKLSERVKFGWFVLIIAILMIASSFLIH